MVVKIQVVLWVVMPCSVMAGYHPKDRQQGPPKLCCPTATLRGITMHKRIM